MKRKSMKKRFKYTILAFVMCIFIIYSFSLIIKKINTFECIGINSFFDENTKYSKNNKDLQYNKDEWNLILVNEQNSIPKDYQSELIQLSNGRSVDSRIYPDLQAMFDDMRSMGIYPIVGEGYRTTEEQAQMMTDKINAYVNDGYSAQTAEELAMQVVAAVGNSEHQLGLAVDINAENPKSTNDEVYAWLAENAYKYGFILRYPNDKTDITGIDFEPWHYRYVGKKAASEIYSQGICLEEYLKE